MTICIYIYIYMLLFTIHPRIEGLKYAKSQFFLAKTQDPRGGRVNDWFWQNPDPRSRFLWKWNISFMDQLDLLAFHTHFPSPIRHEIRNFNKIANKVKSKFPENFMVFIKVIKALLGRPGEIGGIWGGPAPPEKYF